MSAFHQVARFQQTVHVLRVHRVDVSAIYRCLCTKTEGADEKKLETNKRNAIDFRSQKDSRSSTALISHGPRSAPSPGGEKIRPLIGWLT